MESTELITFATASILASVMGKITWDGACGWFETIDSECLKKMNEFEIHLDLCRDWNLKIGEMINIMPHDGSSRRYKLIDIVRSECKFRAVSPVVRKK